MQQNKHKGETPEQRIERHRETAKEKKRRIRMAWQEARDYGTLDKRVLGFLRSIMHQLGLTQRDIAIALGCTQQAVSSAFLTDDMRYSRVQKSLGYYGYHVYATLISTNQQSMEKTGYSYELVGCVTSHKPICLPKYLIANIRKSGRMAFLGIAISESGRSLGSICKQAGIDLTSFRYFIREDDFKVSYLYRIATALSMKVVWHVERAAVI